MKTTKSRYTQQQANGQGPKSQPDVSLVPNFGLMRLPQVLALYPVGKSTWWAGVKSGKFPPPVKISQHITAWRVEDIRALIRSHDSDGSERRRWDG